MKKLGKERLSRKALTLLFGGAAFLILLAVILVVGGGLFAVIGSGAFESLTQTVMSKWGTIVLLIIAGLVISAGITIILSRIIMTPMNRIINSMNEVAEGNFKVRLTVGNPLGRHPTIREFTDSFNTMADELEHTEILRSDFVNNFSHEFKTPIVSIAGFAKLLKRGNITDEEREEYTDIIAEESLKLSEMATNVLNLTKIENQTILTDTTRFNISEQIRGCILLLEEKWSEKDLDLELDFDEVYITANEELLRQVWINLLDNAVKFADPAGVIRVTIGQSDGVVTVAISDTGAEIKEEEYSRIFNKFYQTDRSHSANGNGIGLAVVKKIVKLHHGNVVPESKDGVTTFTVTIPDAE